LSITFNLQSAFDIFNRSIYSPFFGPYCPFILLFFFIIINPLFSCHLDPPFVIFFFILIFSPFICCWLLCVGHCSLVAMWPFTCALTSLTLAFTWFGVVMFKFTSLYPMMNFGTNFRVAMESVLYSFNCWYAFFEVSFDIHWIARSTKLSDSTTLLTLFSSLIVLWFVFCYKVSKYSLDVTTFFDMKPL
jgi:hypothetical protein